MFWNAPEFYMDLIEMLNFNTSVVNSGASFNRRARGSKKAKWGWEGLRERGVWCEAVTSSVVPDYSVVERDIAGRVRAVIL